MLLYFLKFLYLYDFMIGLVIYSDIGGEIKWYCSGF